MTNILLNNYALDANWCCDQLAKYIQTEDKVLVLPFSFREDEVRSAVEADRYYAREGKYYNAIVAPLLKFGIKEENITVANYYSTTKDELTQQINECGILYLTGGLPDLAIERCKNIGIFDELKKFDKTVIGVSAGAMMQLGTFHISPDEDYKEYSVCEGIGWCNDFDIEVHYDCSYAQKMSIRRALIEGNKNIYAIGSEGGLIVEDGMITPIGAVTVFNVK